MDIINTLFFEQPNLKYVLFGMILIAISTASIGTFVFLNKKSLVSDTVAHSVLPGIALAFLLIGEKNIYFLVIGAFISGWLSMLSINYIVNHSKLSEDTAIALVLSVFFGIGIVLLVNIQHSGNAEQSGLEHFIFGKAAALIGSDLKVFSIICCVVIVTIILLFKELKIITFDKSFAQTIGLPVRGLELLIESLMVLAIVAGIQAVGIILTAAMLITPIAIGLFWTQKLRSLLFLAILFNVLSSGIGVYVSYALPKMPTGPWVVVTLMFFLVFSFLFGKNNGLVGNFVQQQKNQFRILQENILKTFYKSGESNNIYLSPKTLDDLLKVRYFDAIPLRLGLFLLKLKKHVYFSENHWLLTHSGLKKATRIIKVHRLWELYLLEYVELMDDHVHQDAEVIEHLITPELEKDLEEKMNYPSHDPHKQKIPYQVPKV